jgi:hypothetical protein
LSYMQIQFPEIWPTMIPFLSIAFLIAGIDGGIPLIIMGNNWQYTRQKTNYQEYDIRKIRVKSHSARTWWPVTRLCNTTIFAGWSRSIDDSSHEKNQPTSTAGTT